MAPTGILPLTLVADDLTGACDTGALFAGRRPVPVTLWPAPAAEAPVRVIDTESRGASPADAAARVAGAAAAARPSRYFKKIDSTLRGPIGPEVDALMGAAGVTSAVVCPAFPSQQRVVLDRVLTVDGVPVAETPVGRDPHFPRGGSSSVVDVLRPQLDRPLSWIAIDQLRAGASHLTALLARLRGTVAVADAETDGDLERLVEAALALDPPPLLVGAAGLARALAGRLGLLGKRAEVPAGRRWLIVAGSLHPATRRQVAVARAAGVAVLATPDSPEPDRARAAARLAAQAAAALAREPFDVVVVTGGETAVALFTALEAERVDLVGAPAPGLALGYLRGRDHDALPIITKAGGFGAPDLLVSLLKEAVA